MSHLVEVTTDNIYQALQAAFLNPSKTSDDDIIVKPGEFKVFVSAKKAGLLTIRYGFQSNQKRETPELLSALNKFNTEYVLLKSFWREGLVYFELDIPSEGGVNMRSVVEALRRTETIIMQADGIHPFIS